MKYLKVLKLCELHEDIKTFPKGDKTIIGDKGINLSGGQKVRLALARALYEDKEVILYDDIMSSLDQNIGESIFRNVILGSKGKKTQVVATHSASLLKHFDLIVLMNEGRIIFQGPFEELEKQYQFRELQRSLTETKKIEVLQKNEPVGTDPSIMTINFQESMFK